MMDIEHADPFIERYILHFQMTSVSSAYLLWTILFKWKSEPTSAKLGKAYIILQKFINQDSYIQVPCINNEDRDKAKEILTKNVAAFENGKPVD